MHNEFSLCSWVYSCAVHSFCTGNKASCTFLYLFAQLNIMWFRVFLKTLSIRTSECTDCIEMRISKKKKKYFNKKKKYWIETPFSNARKEEKKSTLLNSFHFSPWSQSDFYMVPLFRCTHGKCHTHKFIQYFHFTSFFHEFFFLSLFLISRV